MQAHWLHWKLLLVAALAVYHGLCWRWLGDFAEGRNRHSHVYYRWWNEVPVALLIAIVLLAVVKPFPTG
jgi:putative membrane protein